MSGPMTHVLPLIACNECPTAYHNDVFCLPAGSRNKIELMLASKIDKN
jgi:hypothetical protein